MGKNLVSVNDFIVFLNLVVTHSSYSESSGNTPRFLYQPSHNGVMMLSIVTIQGGLHKKRKNPLFTEKTRILCYKPHKFLFRWGQDYSVGNESGTGVRVGGDFID